MNNDELNTEQKNIKLDKKLKKIEKLYTETSKTLAVCEKENNINKELLDVVFNTSPDGVIITSFEGGIITKANDGLFQQTGFTSGDVLGKSTLEINIWKDPSRRKAFINELESKGVCADFMADVQRKDKSCFVGLLYARIVVLQGKKFIITFIKDITERNKSLEKIKQSEEKYKMLAENIKDVIWVLDVETLRFLYVSPSVLELRGYTAEEIMAGSINDAFTPEGAMYIRSKIQAVLKVFLENDENPNMHSIEELQQPHKNGTFVWTEIITSMYRNKTNGKIEIRGVTREISARKKTEEKLKKSEEEYRLLFENAVEAIVVVQEGVIKICNPMAVKLSGYSMQELKSLKFIDMVYPEDKNVVIERHIRRLNGEKVEAKYNFRVIRKDGSYRWAEINSIKILWEGNPATLNFLTDITERKIVEEEIRTKNEELQKINNEKDKLFSIIAHDLRSPFHVLLGLADLIAQNPHSMTYDEIKDIAVSLKNSASNLYSLLTNLLEWSRMQQGMIPFNPRSVLFDYAVNESIVPVFEQAIKKEIELKIMIPENLIINADVDMLQSLIRNLVSNSIKFTNRGGVVEITAGINKNNELETVIKDNGIGMNPNLVKKLFQIDVAVGRKGTNNEPSTGLGLIICKEMVIKHNGKIWVKSEEGKGSSFYFTLPME